MEISAVPAQNPYLERATTALQDHEHSLCSSMCREFGLAGDWRSLVVLPLSRRLSRSSRLRARRSMLCAATISPSRTKASSRSSSGSPGVLARRLAGEHLVHLDVFELPFRVLVEAADADVTDARTVQGILRREMCQEDICNP